MLLLVVVILGSFTFMTLTRSSYLAALTSTVFLTAGTMLLVGLAWNPRSGGGLGVFFARYLFSIGLPVQKWLQELAELLQVEARPEQFLAVTASARNCSGRASTWSSSASSCSHFSTGRPIEKRYLAKNTPSPPPLRGFQASPTSSIVPAVRNTVEVSAAR